MSKRVRWGWTVVAVLAWMMLTVGSWAGGQGDGAGKEKSPATKMNKLVYMANLADHPYIQALINSVKEFGAKNRFDVEVLDARFDASVQANQVDDIIAKKDVDIVLLTPVDTVAIGAGLQKFKKANIPVIDIAAPVDPKFQNLLTSFVGASMYSQGKFAAEIFVSQYGDKPAKVAIIAGSAGMATLEGRTDGFRDYLAQNAPGMKIVSVQYSEWDRQKALALAQDILMANPDLNCFYAWDDDLGAAVIEGIASSGKKPGIDVRVYAIGTGGKEGYNLIKAGKLNGIVLQPADLIMRYGVEAARRYLDEGIIPPTIDIPYPKITKDNVADFKPAF